MMKIFVRNLLPILFVPLFVSCSSSKNSTADIKKKAAFLFNCSENKVRVVNFGNGSFGAKGCGKAAQYQCNNLSGGYCRPSGQ